MSTAAIAHVKAQISKLRAKARKAYSAKQYPAAAKWRFMVGEQQRKLAALRTKARK